MAADMSSPTIVPSADSTAEASSALAVLLHLAQTEGTHGVGSGNSSPKEDAETAATGGLAAECSAAGTTHETKGSVGNGRAGDDNARNNCATVADICGTLCGFNKKTN